jgi:hypothetical protein
MNSAERNYPIYDKEMLAVIRALQKWQHLLLGSAEPFEIQSDHQNLLYYRDPQKLTRRQARWASFLGEYDFAMKHVPGKTNGKADALSRRPDYEQGEEDNKDTRMFKEAVFNNLVLEQTDIYQEIAEAMKNYSTIEECARKQGDNWEEQNDGTITHHGATYIPKNKKLRDRIIELHHDQPMMGHAGPERTEELIERGFYWPEMKHDIKKYCDACNKCQRTKADQR